MAAIQAACWPACGGVLAGALVLLVADAALAARRVGNVFQHRADICWRGAGNCCYSTSAEGCAAAYALESSEQAGGDLFTYWAGSCGPDRDASSDLGLYCGWAV